jgi:UDP-N-acetylmuramate: L-alanyl-gamma-D-glutamyl-meso-diaminopimelate ligase
MDKTQQIHFIAIGGSAMHNLAIALQKKGYTITGSDDEINEPSRSRLARYGLLPENTGWFPEKLNPRTAAVILGMHAREDNPELKKAKELGIKIYSYPEFLFEQTKHKKRVVIAGSHGKTTITSMILHVLNHHHINHDYMVGAQLEGYECMVGLHEHTDIAILEGDEYLSSPDDKRPKFHLYQPHIALVSGIAWDHINVFPTFEIYLQQFAVFFDLIEQNGTLIYYQNDKEINNLLKNIRPDIETLGYDTPPYIIENGITYLINNTEKIPLKIFGTHNLQNLAGAKLVCYKLGISHTQFYEAIKSFKGASRRLELVKQNLHSAFYKDFAHAPSKLKATIDAVKLQYPNRKLTACIELHTFSSLNENFLSQYKDTMNLADEAYVYFNPHTLMHKKLKPITKEQVKTAFNRHDVIVYNNTQELLLTLKNKDWHNNNLLMMSSGNFDGINFDSLADEIIK